MTLFEQTFKGQPGKNLPMVREVLSTSALYDSFLRSNMSKARLDLMLRVEQELRALGWELRDGEPYLHDAVRR